MDPTLIKRLPDYPLHRLDGSLDCRPLYVIWEITLRCDQACKFCGSRAGRARPDELSADEAVAVVRQLAALGTREIALHGGEAYLKPGWLDLVRAATDRGIDCTMVSGGRGISAEVAKNAAAAGLRAVSMSIDGLSPTHDRLRSVRGSYAGVMAAIGHLKDAGIRVGCNTQLNHENFRELPALADVLTSLDLYGWQVQLMVPMGRAADCESLWLQPYDMLDVFPILAEVRATCDQRGLLLWPGDNVGYFGPYEHVLRAGRSLRAHCAGCGGGIVVLGIEANGDVKGCSAMCSDGYVAGNVRTTPIAEMWASAPELAFMRNFKRDDLWGFCHDCYYAEQCKAGCVWTSSSLLGKKGNNPYCHHRALQMLARGKRERLRMVCAAPDVVRGKGRFEIDVEDAPTEWSADMRAKTVTEPPITTARRLADAGEFAHAEAVLTALLEREPDNIAALDLLGFVLFSHGRVAEAELVCRRTLELLPDHPYALKGLGNCLARLGRTDDAVASLRKAIALQPAWFDPYNDLFFALVRAGRADEALETIVRGENEVPGHSAAFARLRKALREDAPA